MDVIPVKTLPGNVDMPVLGLGTWQLTGNQCVQSVEKALQLGYRHIDTAEKYHNEKEIGQAVKSFPREKLFITSKVSAENLTYKGVLNACEGSLSNLGTDYLDLYLVHWPNENIPIEETLEAFKKLQDTGKIRSTGVSNFFARHLQNALPVSKEMKLAISIDQVEFHPLLNDNQLLEYCKKNDVLVTAYSPLAREKALKNSVIRRVAGKYSKTPAQITLRWELQKGVIVIPKSASPKHLEENMNIFDFEIYDDDLDVIDEIPESERLVSI